MKRRNIVSIVKTNQAEYPVFPYNPSKRFPEFNKLNEYRLSTQKENHVYGAVRNSLYQLSLDKGNFNTPKWNPFKTLVSKGNKVIIKPNLVRAQHPLGKEGIMCTITHASIIRPIIDYLILATKGNVEIAICDVPLQTTDWERVIKYSGIKNLIGFYKKNGIKIDLLDLRLEIAKKNKEGIIIKRVCKMGDPKGYIPVDLGKKSALMPIIKEYKKFEITDYPSNTVSKHHNPNKNEYLIPNTILESDLFINVPKLKTHRKTGITFALKNLIGINGDKSWIAHHRRGSVKNGGDEYPKFKFKNLLKYFWTQIKNSKHKLVATLLLKIYKKIFLNNKNFAEAQFKGKNMKGITEGSWYQNDTVWRCIIDINNILFFANKKGKIEKTKQRKYLCIGDGIISGEGEGPMENTPKATGIIISGSNPLSIDRVAAKIIGFMPLKINLLKKSKNFFFIRSDKLNVVKNKNNIKFNFETPTNWEYIKKR